MPVSSYHPLSHGAALEALRSVHEDLRLVCNSYPDLQDRSLEEAIHTVACAKRKIFESYLHQPERPSVKAGGQMPALAAA